MHSTLASFRLGTQLSPVESAFCGTIFPVVPGLCVQQSEIQCCMLISQKEVFQEEVTYCEFHSFVRGVCKCSNRKTKKEVVTVRHINQKEITKPSKNFLTMLF